MVKAPVVRNTMNPTVTAQIEVPILGSPLSTVSYRARDVPRILLMKSWLQPTASTDHLPSYGKKGNGALLLCQVNTLSG